MASKKDLDAGLLELKSDVTQAFRMELSYKRARYKVLVETYLWWRTASQKKVISKMCLREKALVTTQI
jgi:hypothetical protein